jgi:methionyl-tRNA formyltransferase
MKGAFLGTPAAAIASLAATADIIDVEAVITRPDAARGRSGRPVAPPIKAAALEWGIPVLQPRSADELLSAIQSRDLDVGVVVAYGRILPPEVLASTRLGFVNVHFSLLPRWRGAAPVERAILAGDESTGVSLMQLDEGLDTGPVISAIETPIGPDETGGSLTARMSYLGAEMIDEVLPGYLEGDRQPAPQMEGGASVAPRLTVKEGELSADTEADTALRMVRAFQPRPGAWFMAEGERYKISRAVETVDPAPPGELHPSVGCVVLGLADEAIEVVEIQPPGRRPLEARDWMNGRRGEPLRLDDAD